jgi:D-alanyl-D-alanine carboxypeptidase/D-alanyl-D-alanine-endopeptidase (penicillin-binding protein 4)
MPLPGRSLILFLLLFALSFLSPLDGQAVQNEPEINGGYIVTAGGRIIASHNSDSAFFPASTIKLVTCLAALTTLGVDYRFKTSFFLDKNRTLYIKGSGDPALTSDAVAAIAAELAHRGLHTVSDIALDTSLFALDGKADGTENSANPYDAANGALAVNYNTVAIKVLSDGRILSGEKETPLLPIMMEIGKKLASGNHRINPEAFLTTGKLPASLRYSGELFRAMLIQQGIQVTGGIIIAKAPRKLRALYVHSSDATVEDLVRSCLHYSNNYLANQLFLACGAESLGWPATWAKARRAMRAFIDTTWPQHRKVITMVEGSGLSRSDRITPIAMLAVLDCFKPYAHLLKKKNGVSLKSGSLSDAHCYAGYFENGESKDPFVIMLNQKENTRDQLLTRLQQLHAKRM